LLNASVGVQRVMGRLRRPRTIEPPKPAPTTQIRVRSRSAARQVRDGMGDAASASFRPTTHPRRAARPALPAMPLRTLVGRLGHERTVAVAVAGIVLGASFLSVGTARSNGGDTGGPAGDGPSTRLAVAAGLDGDAGIHEDYAAEAQVAADAEPEPSVAGAPNVSALSRIVAIDESDPEAAAVIAKREAQGPGVEGPFLADGTLLKPVAVDTEVADGSDLVKTYKVKAGDTLVEIAKAHGVSMMTLWWANKLESKDDLHRGQVLRIPPVSGLVVTVKAGDTLEAVAKANKVTVDKIVETNGLEDQNLVVGQVLVLPGAKGDPIPTPKPTKKPSATKSSGGGGGGGGGGGSVNPPRSYSGGNFRWPTSSHRVSQYYHYGHYGIDIDGSTGDPIYAAAGGTVTFAGWKNNGGGYQVWIAHGSGLYTTYNHMAGVSVGRGQHVGKGQRIGRMGATGFATGSHLHFEVWRGPIWNGGKRVNPLAYL
jgi:murein DD-endopeptidase MepM/ murein hydrolase activator NlpD